MSASRSDPPRPDRRLIAPAVGCWAVTAIGVVGGSTVSAVLAACSTGVALVGLILVRRAPAGTPRRRGPLLAVIATAGICAGFAGAITVRTAVVERHPVAGLIGHKATVVMVVSDDPHVVSGRGPARVRVAVGVDVASRRVGPVAANLTAPADGWIDLLPGQRVRAIVSVVAPRRADLTVADLRTATAPQAISPPPTHQRWASAVRSGFAESARRALPAPESGLLPGMVLGDTSGMDDQVSTDFGDCGLTHLVAVSGANFTLICAAVVIIARTFGARRYVCAAIVLLTIVAFVILVRPSPSVVRAAVMGVVGVIALVARRRSESVAALCTAVIVVMSIWPALAVAPGFVLSVVATCGLIALAPVIRDRLCGLGINRGLAEMLSVAVAAQVVTAPVVAMVTGTYSVVGVVANLVVAPAVVGITLLGTVGALVDPLSATVSQIVLRFTEPSLWWMVHAARTCANLPVSTVAVGDGIGGFALVLGVTVAVGSGLWWCSRPVGDRSGLVHDVGRLWQHVRGERPTASRPRRRGLPGRAGDRHHRPGSHRSTGRHDRGDPGDPRTRR
ncbi:ComEC/Rec2 family competence protein [Williamsia sp. CHRR-6]|uniref:ComEC/Rec2 family competence protein n=1 Tax=Williamsia sp. CHRR-6 TaxID=2835871 RepID=UPI0027DCB34E|nr:ComEC/Rec2 family competence protein [Williamsia sp. CHRR-6]